MQIKEGSMAFHPASGQPSSSTNFTYSFPSTYPSIFIHTHILKRTLPMHRHWWRSQEAQRDVFAPETDPVDVMSIDAWRNFFRWGGGAWRRCPVWDRDWWKEDESTAPQFKFESQAGSDGRHFQPSQWLVAPAWIGLAILGIPTILIGIGLSTPSKAFPPCLMSTAAAGLWRICVAFGVKCICW